MSINFEVHVTKNAEKDLLQLRGLKTAAIREILELKQNPFKGHPLEGSLKGVRALEFSLESVAYRAAYVVLKNEQICLVFMVGPHERFYEKAERRAKSLLNLLKRQKKSK